LADSSFGESDNIGRMIDLLPDLYYAVNQTLERCTPGFSKKTGVVLWVIASSTAEDEQGPFRLYGEICDRLADWFAMKRENARSEVAKAKRILMNKGLIFIAGRNDHVHLTPQGVDYVSRMRQVAKETVKEALGVLEPSEQIQFVNFVERLITLRKPPIRESDNSSASQPNAIEKS